MTEFFYGIVEDREDHLKIGRCRVRIIGLHTEDKALLPTRDLPWATPIVPITSASISGVGQAPIGPVEGTTVAIVFADEFKQFPIMIGTISGIPSNINNFAIDEDNTDLIFDPKDEEPLPIQREAQIGGDKTTQDELYLGTLTKKQFEVLQNAVRIKESGNKYSAINSIGYIGAYQFGIQALEQLGYIKAGSYFKYRSNGNKDGTDGKGFNDPDVWTGKDGVTSRDKFISNEDVQDKAYTLLIQFNYRSLSRNGVVNMDTPPEKLAGLLGIAHNQGLGAVYKHLKGVVGTDGYGTTTTRYYNEMFSAISGISTAEIANYENVRQGQIDRESISFTDVRKYDVFSSPILSSHSRTVSGFADPNGIYPRMDYINEPDTNRLARGQKIDTTIIGEKEATRRKNIHIGTSSAVWSQPDVPYNAKYPFNHTFTSESGHALEFDDTTNSERINLHHRAGTFIEIDSNGSQTNKIVGHGCTIIEKDGLILIEGNAHVNVVGNITIFAGENTHIECAGNANIKAANVNVKGDTSVNVISPSINMQADASLSLTAPTINLNGYVNTNVGAGLAISAKVNDDIIFKGSHQELAVLNRSAELAFTLEGTDEAASNAELIGAMSVPLNKKAEDNTVKDKPPSQVGVCDFVLPIGLDTQLTTNFKIKNFCINNGFPAGGQHGIAAAELACNLKQLAMNVAEPIFAEFNASRPHITSGLRLAKKDSKSQHERGQAMDIVFLVSHGGSDKAREFHYEMARKIKDLVNFDQLILEYRTNSVVWIHISFKTSGNRGHVFTMNNDKVVGAGLILLKQTA